MLWDAILVSFGVLFGEISRIGEKCVFAVPAIKNQRFPRSEGHGKIFKIGRILDRRLGTDFWDEIRQKGFQNGSQIKENPIKSSVQKKKRFWTKNLGCGDFGILLAG